MDLDFFSAIEKELEIKKEIFKPNWSRYLDYDYIPPKPMYREQEIKEIISRIVDFIMGRATGNIIIYGLPGTGKTMSFLVAMKFLDQYIKKKNYKNVKIIYSKAKGAGISALMVDICSNLNVNVPRRGFSFKEYFREVEKFVENNWYLHICIDEFDNLLLDSKKKFEDLLYYFTRSKNISTTIITNKVDLAREITDARVLSSLDTLNVVPFKSYNKKQCYDILKERVDLAFVDGFLPHESLEHIAEYVAREGGDIRTGLALLRFCGKYAENAGIKVLNKEKVFDLITKYGILRDGELLKNTLSLSEKLAIIAVYDLSLNLRTDVVDASDVYATQDYYRSILKLPGVNRDSFSVYLTRLSTTGLIDIIKKGYGRGKGTKSNIKLKVSRDAVKYLLFEDPDTAPLREYVFKEYDDINPT